MNGAQNKIVVGGKDIYPGDILNDQEESTFRRVQIRETILSHLKKEKQLFDKGIKVLTLFFIDSVDKYRIYDENGEGGLGEYAKIFEEKYNNAKNDFLDLFQQEYNEYLKETDISKVHKGYFPSYFNYLERDDAHRIHDGYFAIDKKKKRMYEVQFDTPKLKEDGLKEDLDSGHILRNLNKNVSD